MFILRETIQKAGKTLKLLNIDNTNRDIYKTNESIDIGIAAALHVTKYKKGTSILKNFYKGVCQFLSALTSHMMEKCSLKHLIIHCSSCLKPNTLAVTSKHDVSKVTFSKMLENLVLQSHISLKVADEAKEQFVKMIEELVPKHHDEFLAFDN